MNVLFITDAYVPNANSSAILMRDLAYEFREKGHKVYILTISETNIQGAENAPVFSDESGIKVIRIKGLKKKNVSFIRRGISEILLPYFMYYKSKEYIKNVDFDLIVNYTPPITFHKLIKNIKRKTNCKVYLVVRDIFPQCAKDSGVLNNKFLFYYFRRKEQQLYNIADFIGVQSEENLKFILGNNKLERKKVEVLYNWINLKSFENINLIDYRKHYNLDDRIICLYAGNIGKYQELDFLLELAKINVDKNNLVFLIVGSGSEKKSLMDKYGTLKNVIFKEFINPEDYPSLVKQCDIGLINLNRNLTIQNIPGKLLGYWAAGIPVLAAVNKGNDINHIIIDSKGGLCSITGDMKNYNSNFLKLYNDINLRKNMGLYGNDYVEKHFSSKSAYETIINHFNEELRSLYNKNE